MDELKAAVDKLVEADVHGLAALVAADEIREIARQRNRLDYAIAVRLVVVDDSGVMVATHGSTAAWLSRCVPL
jgi:hypothetical protein